MLDHSRGIENAQSSRTNCFILTTAVGHVLQMSLATVGEFPDWHRVGIVGCQLEAQGPFRWFLDHAGSFRRV